MRPRLAHLLLAVLLLGCQPAADAPVRLSLTRLHYGRVAFTAERAAELGSVNRQRNADMIPLGVSLSVLDAPPPERERDYNPVVGVAASNWHQFVTLQVTHRGSGASWQGARLHVRWLAQDGPTDGALRLVRRTAPDAISFGVSGHVELRRVVNRRADPTWFTAAQLTAAGLDRSWSYVLDGHLHRLQSELDRLD